MSTSTVKPNDRSSTDKGSSNNDKDPKVAPDRKDNEPQYFNRDADKQKHQHKDADSVDREKVSWDKNTSPDERKEKRN